MDSKIIDMLREESKMRRSIEYLSLKKMGIERCE